MSMLSKAGKTLGKLVNGVSKIAAASGIPLVSTVGSVVDMAISDEKLAKMTEKVQQSKTVDLGKVASTIESALGNTATNAEKQQAVAVVGAVLKQAVPSASVVQSSVENPLILPTVNTVNSMSGSTMITKAKKYWWIIVLVGGAVVVYKMSTKKVAKKRRY